MTNKKTLDVDPKSLQRKLREFLALRDTLDQLIRALELYDRNSVKPLARHRRRTAAR